MTQCNICRNLLIVKNDFGHIGILCLATAVFKEGPLRSRIDLNGTVSAISRNKNNKCSYYKLFLIPSFKILRMKQWILSDSKMKLKKGCLKDISLEYERTFDSEKEYENVSKKENKSEDPIRQLEIF